MAHYTRQSGWGERACYGGQEAQGKGLEDTRGDYKPFTITSVCMICGVVLKVVEQSVLTDTYNKNVISHGLCAEHESAMSAKLDESLKQADDISRRIL